jgi:hypothetical protein
MATEDTVRRAAIEELGTWFGAGSERQPNGPRTYASRDGGTWRGPTDAAWMTRLLGGAPRPRGSMDIGPPGLVAHG